MSTIIVIESRPLIRRGIVQLVSETVPDCHVYATTLWDMRRDVQACGSPSANASRPSRYDLMLLSVEVLETSVSQAIASAQQICPAESILLLSDKPGPWPSGCTSDVVACIPIHMHPEILQAAIRRALCHSFAEPADRDETQASDHAPQEMQEGSISLEFGPPIAERPSSFPQTTVCLDQESKALGLTRRQYEVLVLLARGHTLKSIAQHLNIAAATAKVHAETVYQRLHVHNRTEAIYAAISRGATLGWRNVVQEMITIPVDDNTIAPPGSG